MRTFVVSLPVKDVAASGNFFTQLGFRFDPGIGDERAAGVVVADNALVLLFPEDRFREFINGEISADGTEVILTVSAESRQEVDETLRKALAAGGRPWKPTLDQGPMYAASFQDLDGHVWEVLHMDYSATAGGQD
ncbi:hypothetical protein LX15_005357 [Streptoalloteichus tenebrarius]|uniref:VOC domain-containing protein n=1 Tax=Streptoalloteichus tenebrarius (strain ATCC 17920 / DSM 40477 / JCM 4838 / CBS 697.72 / NBRC 16177 / NCIMB 11028 / NRRL B-12390 / A12253. 1 / ISP 5477) TaxID=1933 RepID=A0ABT1I1K4_STRSD|nr:VOC family protein [Streptoalloteichus tenebrarius]MCP2261631.1 hypothetical protein [Streptoalloteichus tenebrarius]BFE99367.1 VOC family protein [Streptoalloteichus tenebrarius]